MWGLTETQLSLPISDIKMMHYVIELPINQCAPRGKSLKNPLFALCEIGVWPRYVISWEEFPKFWGFPYQLCGLSVSNTSTMAGHSIIFSPGAESPADSKYDVRIEVLDPQTRQPLIEDLFSTI